VSSTNSYAPKQISFAGQVVIVTGGGRGLGRAYGLEIARRGAAVVINDVVGERATSVVAEIAAQGGTAAVSADSITTPEGAQRVVQTAVDAFGTVDAVINNAGILRNNPFEDLSPEQIQSVLDVNVLGSLYVTQSAWPIMKEKGYGRVVLTSSAAGMFTRPGSVNYSTAKAAMWGMCGALRHEGADHGIRVNMILPKATTVMIDDDPIPSIGPQLMSAVATTELDPERREPSLTAQVVSYLASSACEVSGEAFSSCYGVFSRVFVGRAAGWATPDVTAVTVEDIAQHIEEIRDPDGYTIPRSLRDENIVVAERLGILAVTSA
jgi:NAD(P)-dependent dehydrogenase (short-subunit alcohol dehydrogenase family)